jgi:hypothetical protein
MYLVLKILVPVFTNPEHARHLPETTLYVEEFGGKKPGAVRFYAARISHALFKFYVSCLSFLSWITLSQYHVAHLLAVDIPFSSIYCVFLDYS